MIILSRGAPTLYCRIGALGLTGGDFRLAHILHFLHQYSTYSLEIKENILCRKWESEDGQTITWQIVIPDKLKASVLQQLHDSVTGGHLGVKKTLYFDTSAQLGFKLFSFHDNINFKVVSFLCSFSNSSLL
jgi:gamma-glutamyltranspeptidase